MYTGIKYEREFLLATGFLILFLWVYSRRNKTNFHSLKVVRLTANAVLPTIAEPGSIGYDLVSTEEVTLNPGFRQKVSTGIALELPDGVYGRVAPRSGHALRSGIDVLAGVIDPSYRGEVQVIIINSGQSSVYFPAGTKIAQLILERANVYPVEEVEILSETERGENGFGSTDKRK